MRSKLDSNATELLRIRIYLSRETKLFHLEELAKNWQLCRMTLYRYDSAQYRLNSRLEARKTTLLKKVDKTLCQLCFEPLKGHRRCQDCTMLQHGAPECSCDMIREFLTETIALGHS